MECPRGSHRAGVHTVHVPWRHSACLKGMSVAVIMESMCLALSLFLFASSLGADCSNEKDLEERERKGFQASMLCSTCYKSTGHGQCYGRARGPKMYLRALVGQLQQGHGRVVSPLRVKGPGAATAPGKHGAVNSAL